MQIKVKVTVNHSDRWSEIVLHIDLINKLSMTITERDTIIVSELLQCIRFEACLQKRSFLHVLQFLHPYVILYLLKKPLCASHTVNVRGL